jgi:O-antigen ligase
MYFADRLDPKVERTSWLPLLLVIPLAVAGLVDLPGQFREGTITALGVLGAAQVAVAAAGLVGARAYPRVVLSRFLPYGLFLGWMICRSLTVWPFQGGPDQGGLQNGLAYTLFGLEFLLGATVAAATPGATMTVLRRGFLVLDTVALLLVALGLRQGLPGADFEGQWWVSPRSVALLGIIPISWHLASWCHGRRAEGMRALVWILFVVTSLSRTATAVAVLTFLLAMLVHVWLTPGKFVRRAPVTAIGVAVVALMVLAYETTFYERYVEGYTRIEVAGVSISTTGRSTLWPIVIESGMQHPILGGGLGSSQLALAEFVQPHNDYLRIWHDGGFIAAGLFLFAFTRWLVLLRRQYVWAVRTSRRYPEIELAALFTLLGIMLAAITDNGFMYMFVVAPSGLLVGVAFGIRAFEADPSPSTVSTKDTEAPLGA